LTERALRRVGQKKARVSPEFRQWMIQVMHVLCIARTAVSALCNLRRLLFRLTFNSIVASNVFGGVAAAQSASNDAPPVAERSPLSFGLYAGELFKTGLPNFFYQPEDVKFSPSYLIAANINYRFHTFDTIPLQLEGEVDVAKRFNGANEWEVDVLPVVRWTSFPWNRWLYTNARVGALGFSYATGISDWERQNSGDDKGSRLLQFLVMELTFAPSKTSRSEAFIRIHHRSGDYGLFNGAAGGSNYLAVGFRIFR
jgi:hypothetical protein